ncbi:restriction endonuclease subunit S [Paenibacillus crassostreae]|uniref:Type I restriction modification DNA specificity domain-containing protein n=1 Tax=Paenibacillus crassostreae TaxID=1763538 RepID=A0A167EIM7_9BACL|nr:restriction endonuclease subunit S [Paenibacillus crassostreae]AOZ94897.1 hypothetical protein LPB68_21800 [Paenibacillus crassostreae]OAB75580.1 hypothetical protein PNBC_08090 [Paenibacillus crassostreae]
MSKYIPELRFKGFCENFEKFQLGQLGTFKNGMNMDKEDMGKGLPFVNLQDVFGNNVVNSSNLGLVNSSSNQREDYSLKSGDMLFIRSSVKPEGVGEAAVIEKTIPNATYSGFLIRFRAEKDIDNKFKRFIFSSSSIRSQIMKKATTSANTNINQDSLKLINVFLPKLFEQQKIGAFFKQLDDTIVLQQELVVQQQQYKKAMLQKMFPQQGECVPKVRFDGFSGNWVNQKINSLVTPVVREVPKPTESYKRLSVRSHAKGTFHQRVEDPSTISMDKLYVIKENDLVVNITFAWEHAIAVAKKEDEGLLVSHRFPTFIIDKSDINFIHQLVSKENFRKKLDLISPGGAGRNRVLNKRDFINLNVSVPKSLEEQQRIGDYLKQLDDTIALHQKKLEDYQQLKKALLQRMFV